MAPLKQRQCLNAEHFFISIQLQRMFGYYNVVLSVIPPRIVKMKESRLCLICRFQLPRFFFGGG